MNFSISRQKFIKWLLIHLVVFAFLLFYAFFVGCPLQRIFGISCPGCGLSRAWLSFFALDFKAAFSYHPLFIPLTATLWYALHREVLPKKLPKTVEYILLGIICTATIALYVYRLFAGDPVVKIDFDGSVFNKYFFGRFLE